MPLWTDLIDPVEATGIARDEQYLIETARGGSLARFLPNVTVEDDGVGFDVAAAWDRGLGLISMSERLEAVGGSLDIQSAPGAQTKVDLVVPLVAAAIAM